MHQLQRLINKLDGYIRSDSGSKWRRYKQWNVRLHVVGSRVSIIKACMYNSSEYLRRWSGSWGSDVQYSNTDATASSELITKSHEQMTNRKWSKLI